NIKVVNIDKNHTNLTGKQNAINHGIKYCEGEIILNVDADCIVSSSWLSKTISYFTEEVGFIIGFTTTYGSSFFSKLQGLDMIFLMDAAAGSLGLNIPVSCMGSNIGYRKCVLDELGDHRLKYTVTEDTDLFQKVANKTNWKIAVTYGESAVVLTSAEKNVKNFISQRIRWILGGQIGKLWTLFPLYLIFVFNAFLLMAFCLSFFSKNILFAFLFAFSLKTIVDFIRCMIACKELGKIDLLSFFLPYQAFMILYSIITGFGSLFTNKVVWKGETYTRKGSYLNYKID
ncbi:MAG: glycosyltransferase, partial [bacterium]